MKYIQPEVKTIYNKMWDKSHETGLYDTCNGTKKPLWMRLKYVQRQLDFEDKVERQNTKYCPHCHLALPSNGVCDMCD